MNIIFAHDHKLRYDNDKYYTLGGLSDEVTKRYTSIFQHMIIICRAIPIQIYDKNYFELTNSRISVKAVHGTSLFIGNKDKYRIEKLVQQSDGVIVRLPSFIGELVFSYAKKYHKPILSEVVTCPWDSLWNHSYRGKLVAPYMWYRTRKTVECSNYVIYVTNSFLQKRYPTKGISIGCSDVELAQIEKNILSKRISRIQERNQQNQILTLGTLAAVDTRFKGQQFVIKALSILKKEGVIYKYKLAGGGADEYLRRQAQKYDVEDLIEFSGIISHDDIFTWIDSLDLYIQPSQQEGLPRALVEAMSRACPAIGSTAGGIPELLNCNYIFKKGNVSEIVKMLKQVSTTFLTKSAQYNIKMALNYKKEILDRKRSDFYLKFKEFLK